MTVTAITCVTTKLCETSVPLQRPFQASIANESDVGYDFLFRLQPADAAEKPTRTTCGQRLRGRVLVLVVIAYCVGNAFAQQPLGLIVGTVTDPTGATLSAATVTIINAETRVSQTAVTTLTGDYSIPYVGNGIYAIKVEHPGFRSAVMSHVVVRAAQTVRADFRMELGDVKEVVEVPATAIALQMDTATVGTTIDSKLVNELPLNGRTFAQLAILVPGVAPQGATNIGTDRKRGSIGTAFAITANGFSDVQNNFIYDGVPAMDLDSYNFAFSPGATDGLLAT